MVYLRRYLWKDVGEVFHTGDSRALDCPVSNTDTRRTQTPERSYFTCHRWMNLTLPGGRN